MQATTYTAEDLARAQYAARRAIDLRISNAFELVALCDEIEAQLEATTTQEGTMTTEQAVAYLEANGEMILEAPAKWSKRGYRWLPNVGQMMTDAHLVEFATNLRDFNS